MSFMKTGTEILSLRMKGSTKGGLSEIPNFYTNLSPNQRCFLASITPTGYLQGVCLRGEGSTLNLVGTTFRNYFLPFVIFDKISSWWILHLDMNSWKLENPKIDVKNKNE